MIYIYSLIEIVEIKYFQLKKRKNFFPQKILFENNQKIQNSEVFQKKIHYIQKLNLFLRIFLQTHTHTTEEAANAKILQTQICSPA